jgi:hypothetical protein
LPFIELLICLKDILVEKIIDMDIKLLLLTIVLFAIAGGVFYYLNNTYLKKTQLTQKTGQQELEFDAELRHEYSVALLSGDKERALALGKKYYQNLRDGEPTESDEEAISRDLSLIKSA